MNVREVRLELGMTQQAFADYFDIPLKTLQRWEYGKTEVPKHTMKMINRILVLEGKLDVEHSI